MTPKSSNIPRKLMLGLMKVFFDTLYRLRAKQWAEKLGIELWNLGELYCWVIK